MAGRPRWPIRGALAAVLVTVAVGAEASPASALPSNCQQSVVAVTCFWGPGDYTPDNALFSVINERQANLVSHGPRLSVRHSRPSD
jgi:hypothetical protein